MNLLDFISEFPDEASCRLKFRSVRDQKGVVCKKCQSENHYWLASKEMYQCKKCRFRTSLRSGTVMHNSKLPFRYWFAAMHLMTSTKKCFSALEMKRQLNHKRYQPIWEMMHKLRAVMGKRDEGYQLDSVVEMDEGFFETARRKKTSKGPKKTPERLKRGRGSQRQAKVLVMAESENVERPKKGQKSRKCGYFKMIVLPDLKAQTIKKEVQKSVKSSACVQTDGFNGYHKIAQCVKQHISTIAAPKEQSKLLPWVHTAISNAKRTLLGIYHMIESQYIQNYLNEFCYKLNRRYFGDKLFDRLLIAATVPWF